MKKIEPNSLKRALAAGDDGLHPDADELTAFAESTLLPRERETILAHLACCAACRQVLSCAEEVAAKPLEAKPFLMAQRPAWRIMIPSLAAVAAVAIVSTVVVQYELKKPEQNIAISTKPAVENHPAPAQPSRPQEPSLPEKQKKTARKITPAAVAPAPVMVPALPPTGVEPAPQETAQRESAKPEGPRPASARSSIGLQRMGAGVPASANAFAGMTASHAAAVSIARPHWRINPQGQPERAFGEGPWQPVPPNQGTRMQVVSTLGGEVWVGGEKAQVFRSLDNGTSWRIVSLPEKDGNAHTIAHIQFDSPRDITIKAADGTTWTSVDGGETWK